MATSETADANKAPVSTELRIARLLRASECASMIETKWRISSARAKCYGSTAKMIDAALSRIASELRREAGAVDRALVEIRRGGEAERVSKVLDASAQSAERASRLVGAIARNIGAAR